MANTADSLDSLISDSSTSGVLGVPDTAEGQQALGSILKKKATQRQADEEQEEEARRKQAQGKTQPAPEEKRRARPSRFDEAAWDRNVPKHTETKDGKRPVHYFESHGSLKVKRYTIGPKENGQAINFYSAAWGKEGVAIAAARAAGHKTVMLYGSQSQKDKMWLYMMRDNLRAVRDASLGTPVFMMQALSKNGAPFVPSEAIRKQFNEEFMGVVTNPKREASENLKIMSDFYRQQGIEQIPSKVVEDVKRMNGIQSDQPTREPPSTPPQPQQRAPNSSPPVSAPVAYAPSSPFTAAPPLAAAAATAGRDNNGHVVTAPYANIPTAPIYSPPQSDAVTPSPAFAQGSSKFVAVQPEEQPQTSGRRRSAKPTMPYPTVEEINAQSGRRRPEKPTIPYPVMRANTKDVDVEASSVNPHIVPRQKVDVIFYDPDLKLNGSAPTPVDRSTRPTAQFVPVQTDVRDETGEYTGPYKAKGPTSVHVIKQDDRATNVMPVVKPPMPDPRSVMIPPIPPHILSVLRSKDTPTGDMPAAELSVPDSKQGNSNSAVRSGEYDGPYKAKGLTSAHIIKRQAKENDMPAQPPALATPRTAQIMSIPVLPPDLLAEMNAEPQSKSPVATPAPEGMEAPTATKPLIYIGPVRHVTMELTPNLPKQPGVLKKMFDAAAALPGKIYRALTSSKQDPRQQPTEPAFIASLPAQDAPPTSVEQTGSPKGVLTELPIAQAGTLVSSGSPTKRTP